MQILHRFVDRGVSGIWIVEQFLQSIGPGSHNRLQPPDIGRFFLFEGCNALLLCRG